MSTKTYDRLDAIRPEPHCPKCGLEDAFAEPRYSALDINGMSYDEALVWTCGRCGFEVRTRTLDTRRAVA